MQAMRAMRHLGPFPLKDLRNQDGHPQTIPRATDQQDPKPVTSKGLINTPSVPKGTVAD